MTKSKPRTSWTGRSAQRLTRLTLATYGTTCWLCGGAGADSADHVLPRSLGGSDDIENLRPAHRRCNSARGNRIDRRTRQGLDMSGWFTPTTREPDVTTTSDDEDDES